MTNIREEKGKMIPQHDITRIDETHYQVKSQTTQNEYTVISTEYRWNCSCPDRFYRKICCKHIHAVEWSLKIRKEVEKERIVIEQIGSVCPRCKSDKIMKHGIRHNKYGDLQRFSCKDCKKRFSFNLGFEKMRVNPQVISSSMQLYFTGESLRNVQKFLRLQGVEISHQTVYNWIKKYTKLMEKYLERIVPKVGDKWRSDELFLKVKGNTKYLYALMDDETRFWIAQQVADTKYKEDIQKLFQDGKRITQKKPTVLITDGAKNFHQAYLKEFRTIQNPRTKHIQHIHFKGDKNNNKMERLNGEIRDREKVVRGLKKMDSPLLSGYQIYHNYFRPHLALEGKTPSEKAGIEIEGKDKWITVIQNASRN